MREVRVHVGPGLDAKSIQDVLNSGDEDGSDATRMFEVAHALLNQHADDRAEIYSVEVDEVTIDPAYPSQVDVEFTTSWSMHVGCRDMDSSGDEFYSEAATYTADGELIFCVPPRRRPANYC